MDKKDPYWLRMLTITALALLSWALFILVIANLRRWLATKKGSRRFLGRAVWISENHGLSDRGVVCI